jgi:hypothetical protein
LAAFATSTDEAARTRSRSSTGPACESGNARRKNLEVGAAY